MKKHFRNVVEVSVVRGHRRVHIHRHHLLLLAHRQVLEAHGAIRIHHRPRPPVLIQALHLAVHLAAHAQAVLLLVVRDHHRSAVLLAALHRVAMVFLAKKVMVDKRIRTKARPAVLATIAPVQ